VIATLTLPPEWLKSALPEEDVDRSPLARLRSIALRITPSDNAYSFELLVLLSDGDSAMKLEQLMLELRTASAQTLDSYVGAGVAEQLTPRREGATLRLSAHIERSQIEHLWLAPSASSVRN
jgi:hypothetical protein